MHRATEAWQKPGHRWDLPDMIKDGGELVKQSLLWLFNCMLARHFPERLSVGLVTAVYTPGDKSDMSNYRGITGSWFCYEAVIPSQRAPARFLR